MSNKSEDYIKCLQINLQRSRIGTANLCKTIDDNNIDIILVQEPHIINGKVVGFPLNYKTIYNQNSIEPKTAIIITKKSVQSVFIQSLSQQNITVVKCEFNLKTITLISAYFSPFDKITTDLHDLQTVINILKPKHYIIGGDFNAHSRVWFNNSDDDRGNKMNDFIASNNLIIMNEKSFGPTYEGFNGSSTIDLTLINLNCCDFVKNWHILDTDSHSDHNYINFELSAKNEKVLFQSTFKYKTNTDNWDDFIENMTQELTTLKEDLKRVNNILKLNSFVDNFTAKLTKVCDNSFRKVCFDFVHKNSNKWWTEELSKLRHEVNTSRRRFQRCQTNRRPELLNDYKVLRLQFKQLVIKTKLEKWESFVAINSRDNPFGLIYKISREKINQQKICEIINKSNELITDSTGIATTLINELFPNDNPQEDNDYHKNMRQFSATTDNSECDLAFSELEITDIVNKQNGSKAPGVDGVTADIIKCIHTIDSTFLTKLYNKCLTLETFPDIWKKSVVKVIPKADKTDYTKTDSYRPISLLPVMGKIYEKLLINRVMDYFRKNNQLNDKQYGFSPQKSTEDALHSLTSFVRDSFRRKGFGLVISLDIKGAFNYCWFPKILSQLKVKNCPKNLFNTFKSYFERREAEIWYLNKSIKRKITVGCPQGSSSGPFLWNIAFDDIFDLTTNEDIIIESFADDTIIKIFADNITELEMKANSILEKVVTFATNNKLIFNVTKTKCVLFTRKLKYDQPVITFDGQHLPLVNQFKHLGVIIDSKLTWRPHSTYIRGKVLKVTNYLLRFAKNKFGLNSDALRVIYKGAILPIIGYAVSVWADSLDRKFVIEPLQSIQRRYALRMIKAYRTVSTNAANVIANLVPINLYLKGRAAEYFAMRNIEHRFYKQYFEDNNIDIECILRPVPIKNLKHFGKRAKIQTILGNNECIVTNQTNQINLTNATSLTDVNNITEVYVDASLDTNAVGAAYIIQTKDDRILKQQKFKMSTNWSPFQATIFALNEALNHLVTIKESTRSMTTSSAPSLTCFNIAINLHNKSMISALSDHNSTNDLIFRIYEKNYELMNKNTKLFIIHKQFIRFKWF